MENFSILQALFCVITTIILDIVWALYVRRTATGDALQSALYAVGIMGLGAFNTISYIENVWYLPFSIFGAFIGTYAIVKWEHSKQLKNNQP